MCSKLKLSSEFGFCAQIYPKTYYFNFWGHFMVFSRVSRNRDFRLFHQNSQTGLEPKSTKNQLFFNFRPFLFKLIPGPKLRLWDQFLHQIWLLSLMHRISLNFPISATEPFKCQVSAFSAEYTCPGGSLRSHFLRKPGYLRLTKTEMLLTVDAKNCWATHF